MFLVVVGRIGNAWWGNEDVFNPPQKKKTSRLVMKWRGGNAKHRKNEIRARNQNKIYRVRYLITNREVV